MIRGQSDQPHSRMHDQWHCVLWWLSMSDLFIYCVQALPSQLLGMRVALASNTGIFYCVYICTHHAVLCTNKLNVQKTADAGLLLHPLNTEYRCRVYQVCLVCSGSRCYSVCVHRHSEVQRDVEVHCVGSQQVVSILFCHPRQPHPERLKCSKNGVKLVFCWSTQGVSMPSGLRFDLASFPGIGRKHLVHVVV